MKIKMLRKRKNCGFLGPNNKQLIYLHFFVCLFVRSFVCTFVRTFICLYVCSFVCSFSMFVRLYCMINTSTRGKQHKKIALPHTRSVVRAHTAHTQRRLLTPLAHTKNCRTLARSVARAHTAHTRRSSHMPRIEQMQCQMLKLQQIWIKYLLY